jgi:hypothetical protein
MCYRTLRSLVTIAQSLDFELPMHSMLACGYCEVHGGVETGTLSTVRARMVRAQRTLVKQAVQLALQTLNQGAACKQPASLDLAHQLSLHFKHFLITSTNCACKHLHAAVHSSVGTVTLSCFFV